MTEWADVPESILGGVRAVCLALPEVTEQPAWTGRRWHVRRRSFAHVYALDSPHGPVTGMTFRSVPPERDVLLASGHPFFRPGWGDEAVAMVLDPSVDWTEVTELITESYCLLAPKKLAALVGRPGD